MIKIDSVVTLDDGKEYYLIDKNEIEGITYFYAVEYSEDPDEQLEKEYYFFRLEENKYLVEEEDPDIKAILLKRFIAKIN